MKVADVDVFAATVTLPFDDLERATAALRGQLRLNAAAADRQVPDWSTLDVTEVGSEPDAHGRPWWTWSATVAAMAAQP